MSKTKKLAIAGILSGACLAVHAAPVTYLAADNNVTTLAQMVNSTAAAASFLSVAGALNTVDFESPLPANLTITGGTIGGLDTRFGDSAGRGGGIGVHLFAELLARGHQRVALFLDRGLVVAFDGFFNGFEHIRFIFYDRRYFIEVAISFRVGIDDSLTTVL